MAFQFPWTNLHELNLDWFLSKFKQFTDNYLATTATAESVPYTDAPSVTVTGGELDDDTDIVDPFTFNFKIPAGAQGEQGVQGVPGQDGFSPIATVTKTGTVATITITDVNGTTTTTISDGEVTQAQLDTKAPAILPTVSGSVANFSDGADDMPMSELMADIVPVQSGSGNPAPDNIRPISGWTGVNVTRARKNLLTVQPTLQTNQSQLICDMGRNITGQLFTFTFDFNNINYQSANSALIDFREEDGTHHYLTAYNFYNEYNTNLPNAVKPASGRYSYTGNFKFRYVYSYFMSASYGKWTGAINNAQLELGSTATAYEPYQSNTVTVDWTTEAGTVYVGTIDVTTGLLTVTHKSYTFTGSETFLKSGTAYNGFYSYYLRDDVASVDKIKISSPIMCDTLIYTPNANTYFYNYGYVLADNAINFSIDPAIVGNTIQSFTTWLSSHNIQIVYPLLTPQTYQLTPQQIFNTVYGVNNVWSNIGDSTVTYTADTMLYIQNLTQPTEDDMVANTAIANGKFFMIGNNLYRATTAIASGSQIIPGTNATPMSLADALNLL